MNMIIINCIVILIGAFIMLHSIVKSKHIRKSMPLVPEKVRDSITHLVNMNRLLMCFFLVGYVVVLVGFFVQTESMNNFIVSVIFLFGSIFVFMGISIEIQLLSEIQKTLRGLLPICAGCKKIRESGTDVNDPKSWKHIEEYISARSNVDFTHGYCPQCYEKSMQDAGIEEEAYKID